MVCEIVVRVVLSEWVLQSVTGALSRYWQGRAVCERGGDLVAWQETRSS